MTEQERDEILLEVRRLIKGIYDDFQFLRKHRNMLLGTPVLEFDEVCSMLRQSERSVRRLRESGQLVGFTYGRRRFYSLREVEAFIACMERGKQISGEETDNPISNERD